MKNITARTSTSKVHREKRRRSRGILIFCHFHAICIFFFAIIDSSQANPSQAVFSQSESPVSSNSVQVHPGLIIRHGVIQNAPKTRVGGTLAPTGNILPDWYGIDLKPKCERKRIEAGWCRMLCLKRHVNVSCELCRSGCWWRLRTPWSVKSQTKAEGDCLGQMAIAPVYGRLLYFPVHQDFPHGK